MVRHPGLLRSLPRAAHEDRRLAALPAGDEQPGWEGASHEVAAAVPPAPGDLTRGPVAAGPGEDPRSRPRLRHARGLAAQRQAAVVVVEPGHVALVPAGPPPAVAVARPCG